MSDPYGDEEIFLRDQGRCPTCTVLVDEKEFRDEAAYREYGLSGMCQNCQDEAFGGTA